MILEGQKTPNGRSKLRERVTVEHSLDISGVVRLSRSVAQPWASLLGDIEAHIGQWQGERARYLGYITNLLALRRLAVVHNLHVFARMPVTTQEQTAENLRLG